MNPYSEEISKILNDIKASESKQERDDNIKLLLDKTLIHFARIARFRLFDRSYLDDAISMLYRKTVLYINSFDGSNRGFNWMYTILVRIIYTMNDKIGKYRENEIPIFDTLDACFGDGSELRSAIMLALDRTEEINRDIIIMYYFDNYTLEEIGKKYNMSKSAVYYRKRAAERVIKDFFENYYNL